MRCGRAAFDTVERAKRRESNIAAATEPLRRLGNVVTRYADDDGRSTAGGRRGTSTAITLALRRPGIGASCG